MIDCLIFSKDRAFQLDALISSIHQNCPIFDKIKVIYTYSSQEFKEAYERFQARFPHVELIEESGNFTSLTRKVVGECSEYICLMSDDSIFYRQAEFEAGKVGEILSTNPEVALVSLRVGLNLTEQKIGPMPYKTKIIDYEDHGVFISWDRTRYPPWTVLNYPWSLDGHIFRTWQLSQALECVEFSGPNDLEVKLLGQAWKLPRTISSAKNSLCVNISYNAVQTAIPNPLGEFRYSVEDFNQMYLDGIILDYESMDFSNVHSEHQEIKPEFITPLISQEIIEEIRKWHPKDLDQFMKDVIVGGWRE